MSAREAKLAEVGASRIQATWFTPEGKDDAWLTLSLPHGCHFFANQFVTRDKIINASWLEVNSELRGGRIGQRLTRSLAAVAFKYGYSTLRATVASEYSLDIFTRTFGAERITYWSPDGHPQSTIDTILARSVLVQRGRLEPDLEDRTEGFPTTVDLRGLDTSGWELPVESFDLKFDARRLPQTQ